MAKYLAMQIEAGGLDYKAVFSISWYVQFKNDVATILIADGRVVLIVPLSWLKPGSFQLKELAGKGGGR